MGGGEKLMKKERKIRIGVFVLRERGHARSLFGVAHDIAVAVWLPEPHVR